VLLIESLDMSVGIRFRVGGRPKVVEDPDGGADEEAGDMMWFTSSVSRLVPAMMIPLPS
jgi:hypothetical protein